MTSSGFRWSLRSRLRMRGLHPDLRNVADRALQLSPLDLVVLEGLRTASRQRSLIDSGASRTMRSRHLTGHAIDIAPLDLAGKVSWAWPLYYEIEPAFKQAAAELDIPIEWGGDWASFRDGPHWQLPWADYPA